MKAVHYRFTGKERDEESGLYYHGARYYIPWLARWCSVDPMESKYAGMSPYNYSFNNPVRYNDPSGMSGENTIPETYNERPVQYSQDAEGNTWAYGYNPESHLYDIGLGGVSAKSLDEVVIKSSEYQEYVYQDLGPGEYHFKMWMSNKDGSAKLELLSFRSTNPHSFLGYEYETDIDVKRFIVDFELLDEGSRTYYINFPAYGKGYSNAWLGEDFEDNYMKKSGNPIAFYYNYAPEGGSIAASTAYYTMNAQNQVMETAIPAYGAEEPTLVTLRSRKDYDLIDVFFKENIIESIPSQRNASGKVVRGKMDIYRSQDIFRPEGLSDETLRLYRKQAIEIKSKYDPSKSAYQEQTRRIELIDRILPTKNK